MEKKQPRRVARKERIEEGILISTIEAGYLELYGKYETAVSMDCWPDWKIAEGYETEEEALKGHERYSRMTKEELKGLRYIG